LKKISILILLLSIFLLVSCSDDESVTVAEQYGLAYAPLQIMREKAFFEELEPDTEIKWVKLGNTAAIREAVLAGEVDLGFMGLPPFLIGADKGMDWKLIAGLSVCPVGLVSASSVIPDFTALDSSYRIALPQPGSIQHILLSMAAEKEKGDAAFYDNSLVTMKHPDGMTALLSGSVDAHFTSPPYIFMENEAGGFKTILSGSQAFGGDFSFIGAMAAGKFIKDSSGKLESFITALEKSIDFINSHPGESARLLSGIYDLPEEDILEYITHEEMEYTTEIFGLERFITFMSDNGYLSGNLAPEDVLYR